MKKLVIFVALLSIAYATWAEETVSPELIRTFAGHSNSVWSVSFSPDGKQALSGSWDKTMKLWDVNTGAELRTFAGHSGSVESVSFSSDGQRALSGSQDNAMKLWNVNTWAVQTFTGHTSNVMSVAFSPNGQRALSGSVDKTLKLWDINTGTELRTFTGHTDDVISVAFSSDGQRALSGSDDGTMKLWDINTGAVLRTFTGHTGVVESVAFSLDGQRALSGSSDNTMKLWDINTGAVLRTFTGHAYYVLSVAYSPDGQRALSGSSDNTLKLWDINNGAELRTFTGHTDGVNSVAFSPDGQRALSGSSDRTMKLWDVSAFMAATVKESSTTKKSTDSDTATVEKSSTTEKSTDSDIATVEKSSTTEKSVDCSPFVSDPRSLDIILSDYNKQKQVVENQQKELLSAQQPLIDLQGQVKAVNIDIADKKNIVEDKKAKLQKAQEMELMRADFSAEKERTAYHQAQQALQNSSNRLAELNQNIVEAEKQISHIQSAITPLHAKLAELCGEIAAARFQLLKTQLEKTREVTARGEAACNDNMTIRECKTQAESEAKRKASQQGAAILIESVNLTQIFGEDNKPEKVSIQEKITQQFSSLLLKHEILNEGFVSNGVYFYEIRATVQGQVPEKLKAEFLK